MSSLYNNSGFIYYSVRYVDLNGKRKKKALSLRMKYNEQNLEKAELIKKDLDKKFNEIVYRGTDLTVNLSVNLFLRTKKAKSTKFTYKSELKPLLIKYKDKKINEIDFNEIMKDKSFSQKKHLKSFVIFLYKKGYIKILIKN